MKSNYILSCILAMLIGLPNVRGQSIGPSVLNAMGGSGTAGGNTFEWSVGEVMVSTFVSSSVVVTQGVLQPRESGSSGVVEGTLPGRLEVFPNPSSALVNIQFNAPSQGTFTYKLVDVLGRVIIENSTDVKAGATSRQLDIKSLACATYMLHVLYKTNGAAEETATYKIQKLD